MQLARRVALSNRRMVAMRLPVTGSSSSRFMSVGVDAKERGEEAVYFQREDARLRSELRKNMEKILELHDSHEDKQDLVKLLSKEKEADKDRSFISKLGLDDWKLAMPLGLLAGIPALANEVIILGPEAQLAACFVLFCSTMYTQVGPMASKFFQDYQDNVAKDLRQVDENMLVEVKHNIESTTQLLDLEKDLTAITSLRDDLAVVQADVLNHMEQHKFRDAIARKLDSLVAIEEAATVAIRKRMVNKVKEDVVSAFANDRKAKDKALDSAIAVLSAGVGAKRGKDVVGEAFVKSIAQYREDYAKKPASEDPLIVQFEKDVAAVATAPLVNFQATNVYVSHPLQGAAPAAASKKH